MVIIEDSVWKSFNNAKDALLMSFPSQIPPLPHISTAIASQTDRATIRAQGAEFVNAISETLQRLEEAQTSLASAQKNLSRMREDVLKSIAPINAIPPELIHNIVLHTIQSPSERERIMNLSQVSCLWRSVVRGISSLFVSADWIRWTDELFEEWCDRAKHRPLIAILVGYDAEELQRSRIKRAFNRLKHHAAQLQTLEFHATRAWPLAPVSRILAVPNPRLRHLRVYGIKSRACAINIIPENVPSLETLYLDRTFLFLSDMGTFQLKSLEWSVSSLSEWSSLFQVLGRLSGIVNLSIDGEHFPVLDRDDLEEATPLFLSSLTYLRLQNFYNDDVEEFATLINALVAPNLLSLELSSIDCSLHDRLYHTSVDISATVASSTYRRLSS